MKKEDLIEYISANIGNEEPVFIVPEDSKQLLIEDIPNNIIIEISTVKDKVHHIELEGSIQWSNDKFCIHMAHNWYRKWWSAPLGMPYHMDLMKRLIEFRQKESGDVSDIEFTDDGDWCHLYYTILPPKMSTLHEVYEYGLSVSQWVNSIVNEAQEKASKLISDIASEYSNFKLFEIPELIDKVQTEEDSNVKGRLLEELMCKFFECIKDFSIIDRLKTETEEIDLVILNKSTEPFWQKESQLILVECKNWSSKCGKNELVIFKEKIKNRRNRSKLGFFISWNGFTETFSKEDIRTAQGDILLVPVTGEEIIEAFKSDSIHTHIEKWWLAAVSS